MLFLIAILNEMSSIHFYMNYINSFKYVGNKDISSLPASDNGCTSL